MNQDYGGSNLSAENVLQWASAGKQKERYQMQERNLCGAKDLESYFFYIRKSNGVFGWQIIR